MHPYQSTMASDRRQEPRFHLPDETVVWQRFYIKLSLGSLYDISRSGASFVSDAQPCDLPEIGEEIRVRHAGMKRRHVYEVVRLERVDGDKALIACQKTHPKVHPTMRLPQHSESARAIADESMN